MPTRVVNLVLDCARPELVGRFWARLLSSPLRRHTPPGGEQERSVSTPTGLDLDIGFAPERKNVHNRVHVDIASRSRDHQRELIGRALAAGASRIDIGQGDVPWAVLADPDGNEFCVLEPRPEYPPERVLAAIVMHTPDPLAAARFWAAATGLVPRVMGGMVRLAGVDQLPVELLPSDTDTIDVAEPAWAHLDVAPQRDGDQRVEVERLCALGARRIDIGQGDVPWEVLSSPWGERFCVLTPR